MLSLPIYPAFEKNNLAITLEASEFFAAPASVTILSIIENASPAYNYDFVVLTWDMREETAQKLISTAEGRKNVSIRIVNILKEIEAYKGIQERAARFSEFSYTCLVRIFLVTLMVNYDTILNLDCDLLICGNISELFSHDMSDYYMGGVPDVMGYVQNRRPGATSMTDDYVFNRLKLTSVSEYVNGGVVMLNLQKIRAAFTQKQIIDFAVDDGTLLPFGEQDTFNGLFSGHKLMLPFEWNWQIDNERMLIETGKRYLPINDELLERYYSAENNIKCYHYLCEKKPWTSAKVSYGNKWWEVAKRSPFIDSFLPNTHSTNANKHLLFLCGSSFQLVSALNIKLHYYPDVTADLLIHSSTQIINAVDRIEKANIFQKIIVSNYKHNVDYSKIIEMPIAERSLHPERYEHMPALCAQYTDLFISVCKYHYHQMIYYYLVNAGKKPAVHIYDEGVSNYTDNLKAHEYRMIDHSCYPDDKRFHANIDSIFLYAPEFYCGSSKILIVPIPRLSSDDTELEKMLLSIFGKCELPNEKYLFFNEPFAEDEKISNEIQILDAVAAIVGKDNIALSVHPDSAKMEDIYRLHGYHIFSDNGVPWELIAYSSKIDNKVLMSISSSTIYTPLLVCGKTSKSISLLNVMKLSKRSYARFQEYQRLLGKIQAASNKDGITFYIPNTLLELKNIIRYIEGET